MNVNTAKTTLLFIISIFTFSNAHAQIANDAQAKIEITKGDSLFLHDEVEMALVKYKAVSEFYKAKNWWKEYTNTQAKIAECLTIKGLYNESIAISTEALGDILEKKINNTESEGTLLNELGFAQLNKGRNDLAMENFNKAIVILANLKQVNKLKLSDCYENLGLANWNIANNELALEHLQKSLSLKLEVLDPNHPEIANAYNNLGLIYTGNDFKMALDYYEKAQEIYVKMFGEEHSKVTNTLTNIAIIQRKQKMYDQALVNFQKVLATWSKSETKHPKEGFVYSNVAEVYLDKGEIEKALELKYKALALYKESYGEKHPEIANLYNQIGNILLEKKDLKGALAHYQSSLIANGANFSSANLNDNPTTELYYNGNILIQSLQLKARALEQQYATKTLKVNDLKTALYCYYACDTLIEKIRKIQTNKNDKIELGKIASVIYEDAIRICMSIRDVSVSKNKYNKIAFQFSEKSKTAVLLEAISDAEAKHFAGIPDTLLEKEKAIKNELSFYEQKLAQNANAEKEVMLRNELFNLNRQYEALINTMEKQFPEYYNLKYNIKTTSVASIQKNLKKEEALVSYFIADESNRVYVFYLKNKTYKVFDLPKNDALDRLIIGYRNSIKVDAKEVYRETATSLYQQLIPFKPKKYLKKLIVIPDGKIGTIPFEALLTKKVSGKNNDYSNYPFFIKKCAISYNYSANLFEQSNNKSTNNEGDIFVCAPIEFSGHSNYGLNDLPGTEEETNSIQKMFNDKGIQCHSYKRDKVQESLLKSDQLKEYRYLHFATHGVVDENKPELSEIFLSPDPTQKEDGNLYSGEIYNLKIGADLVTLSACQTGLGKIQKGEGIIGLSRALLYAGAKNLVVSLWSVADKSTSLLMIDFYAEILQNKNTSNYIYPLRNSKLKMISQSEYNKPYYWAPFILIGK